MTTDRTYLAVTRNQRAPGQPVLEAHLEHLAQLEAQGALVLAGPFGDRSGGAYVFRAGSEEAARGVLDEDPLVEQGFAEGVLHAWCIE